MKYPASWLLQAWPCILHNYAIVFIGGLALWIEADPKVDMQDLYYSLLQEKIVITPGVLFSTNERFKNYLRLSFNHPTTGNRKNAVKRLAEMI